MQNANNQTFVFHRGYAVGFRSEKGPDLYLAENYSTHSRHQIAPYQPPPEWFSPLIGVERYPNMSSIKMHLGKLFDDHVSQSYDFSFLDPKQQTLLTKELGKVKNEVLFRPRAAHEIIIAKFEMALRPVDLASVDLALDFTKLGDVAYKIENLQSGGTLAWNEFMQSLDPGSPAGFEPAGFLVVNKNSMRTTKPKYIYHSSISNRLEIDFWDSPIDHKSPDKHTYLPFMGSLTDYAPVLLRPGSKAQVMRAGIRVVPLLPLYAGLIEHYETALAEGKCDAAESADGIARALRVNQHAYEMKRPVAQVAQLRVA